MFVPILFGIIASIIIYAVVKVLLADDDVFNFWLNIIRAAVLIIISVVILLFKSGLIKMFWNAIFWNTVIIATIVIALYIVAYSLYRLSSGKIEEGEE